jgi:hypothetical protein
MTIIAHACLALILRFRPLGCRDSDFAQHGHKATQRSRFTAASDIPVAFQKTVDDTFIEIAQTDVLAVEPFAEPGYCIQLHGHRRWQKALLLNALQVKVNVRCHGAHAEPRQKIRGDEILH